MKIVTNKAIMLCKTKEFENEQVIERKMNMVTNKAIILLKKRDWENEQSRTNPIFSREKPSRLDSNSLQLREPLYSCQRRLFQHF